MSYLTKTMSTNALARMKQFHSELSSLFGRYEIDIEGDTGRRNMLMSSLQEKTFAHELKAKFSGAFANGKTGEPDIIIPEISKELECKLTSKNRSGSWSLQTDYNTLAAKGTLDYLYVLASKDFQEFAVLYFEGLDCNDFHLPAPGSKGKSRMKVAKALKKCTPLVGSVHDKSNVYIQRAKAVIDNPKSTKRQLEKASNQLKHWSQTSRISFSLENINECMK